MRRIITRPVGQVDVHGRTGTAHMLYRGNGPEAVLVRMTDYPIVLTYVWRRGSDEPFRRVPVDVFDMPSLATAAAAALAVLDEEKSFQPA